MSVDDVLEFLRSRSLPDRALERIQEEKIDAETVLGSDDQTLARFIPTLGDRIALKNFCAKNQKSLNTTETKRSRLFGILKAKMNAMDKTKSSPSTSSPNAHARKMTRKVEFGWIHKGRQVRKRLGGGCRKVDVDRNASKFQLLHIGKGLFFPEGLSTKGKEEEFEFDILDFKETPLPPTSTVNECYEVFKTGLVTFYLHTSDKGQGQSSSGQSAGQGQSSSGQSAGQDQISSGHSVGQGRSTSARSAGQGTTAKLDASNTTEIYHGKQSGLYTIDATDILGEAAASVGGFPDDDFDLPDINVGDFDFNFTLAGGGVPTETKDVQSVEMTIHRGSLVLSELCSYFKDASIMNKIINIVRILPNGDIEKAQDTGGVFKDTLTEFWELFYSQCTVGRDVKVPFLRHDYGQEEWNAVGRILVYGWKHQGYWPVKMSHVFLHHCLFPQLPIPQDKLLESFYGFISSVDKDVFTNAVQNFADADIDEIIEALEEHECRTAINRDNILPVILEIAHKELIQTPMYVSDCWRDIIGVVHMTSAQLENVYKSLVPSNKGVIQIMKFPPCNTTEENTTVKHLKRYVKELDAKKLGMFLRFCTGSDLVTVEQITVELLPMKPFERRPIGHTCGCVLQIGEHYDTFAEFRSEFDSVLDSNIWVMDIV
ncbi:uncharacterized protein LOC124265079 [Haliotis rubra]|uniref:uncharacterized protein LOC124265079 n=1 Tax=Haliotis rubra TaxID=36100 RepID=UPI001EE62E8A|nr:uncharacterized protein LOC124265079 [Haliotis rubra]